MLKLICDFFSSRNGERGQIMSEYALMLLCCALIGMAMFALFYYYSLYGYKLLNLVGIEYP